MYAVWKIKIGGEHGAVEGGKAELVEKAELNAGEIAVRKKWLGMSGDGCEVEAVEQVIRTVAAAEGHDGAGIRIGKCGVEIGEALGASSGKVERPAMQRVGARLGREAESFESSEAALDAITVAQMRRGRRWRWQRPARRPAV